MEKYFINDDMLGFFIEYGNLQTEDFEEEMEKSAQQYFRLKKIWMIKNKIKK